MSFQIIRDPDVFHDFFDSFLIVSPVRSSTLTYGCNFPISLTLSGHGSPEAPMTYTTLVHKNKAGTSIVRYKLLGLPSLRYEGFSTMPPVPANSASFCIIPRSNFCQFRATSWAPFLQNMAGSWFELENRRPKGYTRVRYLELCSLSSAGHCSASFLKPRSEKEWMWLKSLERGWENEW